MALLDLRHAVNVTLAVLAATALLAAAVPAERLATFGAATAIAIVVAPVRRDPAGGAAVPTEPWPGAALKPSGLVPLMPGVGLRLPAALPNRRRPDPARPTFPRRTVRAVALFLIALAVAVAVLPPQIQEECPNSLSLLDPQECAWHVELATGGAAALSVLLLTAVYAASTLRRTR